MVKWPTSISAHIRTGESTVAETEEPKTSKSKVIQRRLSDDDKEALNAIFEERDEEGNPLSIDEISDRTGIHRATVSRHRNQWNKRREDEEALTSATVRPDPFKVYQSQLADTPGLSPEKVRWSLRVVQSAPQILRNPQDLYQHLTKALRIQEYMANLIVQTVANAVAQDGSAPTFLGPFGQSQPPVVLGGQSPMGWGMPQMMPFGGQPMVVGQTPQGQPIYQMPPPQNHQPTVAEITAQLEERRRLEKMEEKIAGVPNVVKDILKEVLAATQQSQASNNMEEFQEPIMNPETGEPVVNPKTGEPIMRWIRRPMGGGHQQQPMLELANAVKALKDNTSVDILREQLQTRQDPQVALMMQQMQQLTAAIANQSGKQDPELKALMERQQEQMMTLLADVKAEKARTEEREKWFGVIEKKNDELRLAAGEVEAAKSGLPADAIVLRDGLSVLQSTVNRFQDNSEKRWERLESMVTKVLAPVPSGTPVGVSPETVEDLARRAEQAVRP